VNATYLTLAYRNSSNTTVSFFRKRPIAVRMLLCCCIAVTSAAGLFAQQPRIAPKQLQPSEVAVLAAADMQPVF